MEKLDLENGHGVEDRERESWLKSAFKEEWPTMGNHLIAAAVATGAATGVSYLSKNYIESDAAISGLATFIDSTSYWGTLLPQLIWRDRKKLRDDDGSFNKKKVLKKAGEYAGTIGIIEGAYTVGRFLTQYFLQKEGWEPENASLAIQLGATALFTFAFPPIRYAAKQLSEK